MIEKFDKEKAKKWLLEREEKEKQLLEMERKALLEKVISILRRELTHSSVEVYLVGSILRPFSFSPHSDIDIVLKNFKGDRFDFWAKIEKEMGKTVEIIPFETCVFQEFVLKNGFKVL